MMLGAPMRGGGAGPGLPVITKDHERSSGLGRATDVFGPGVDLVAGRMAEDRLSAPGRDLAEGRRADEGVERLRVVPLAQDRERVGVVDPLVEVARPVA